MSEVVQETQHEFWRAPSPVAVADNEMPQEAIPTMAETCSGCGSEFLLGSRYCPGGRVENWGRARRVISAKPAGSPSLARPAEARGEQGRVLVEDDRLATVS